MTAVPAHRSPCVPSLSSTALRRSRQRRTLFLRGRSTPPRPLLARTPPPRPLLARTPPPRPLLARTPPPRPICTDHADWNRLHSRRAQRAALRESTRSGMTFGDLAAERRRGRRVAGWVALTLAVIVTVAVLGAYWKFRSLWTSINHVAVG